MRNLVNKKLLITITIYLFISINLIINNTTFYTNKINPLFWSVILIYEIWDIKKNYIRFNTDKRYIIYMFIISLAHIIIYFYLGFILGFLKSPYDHKIISIIKNTLIKIIPLIGIEFTRSIIITRNKNNKKLILYLTVILFLLEVKYNTLINLYKNKELFFEYICEAIIPEIACGIFYTYLNLDCSYLVVLTYRFFKEIIILFLPNLPNVNWFINGSARTLSPAIIYILFKYKFSKEKVDTRKRKEEFYAKISYIVTIIISTTLVMFMIGVFKYEPIAILSNSMNPTFNRGDVVIYKKMSESELKEISESTIIIYSIGEQNIAHRVVNVVKEEETSYQTKGDSNNTPDKNLVKINQIKGKYIFHIKYIGIPSVWLYDFFHK